MVNRISLRRTASGIAMLGLLALCAPVAAASGPEGAWRKLALAHNPSPRANMIMAYDPVGKNIVMFGGYDGIYLNDTWIFNGSDWIQLSPASAPPVRSAAAMSFDRASGKMVMFGGFNGNNYLGDTWLWDGAKQTWTEGHPITLPTAVTLPMMFTDPLDGHAGMIGGFDGNFFYNNNWVWTGTDWRERFSKTVLWARGAAVVANDLAHGTVLIFGGLGDVNPNNTWTWDGVDWTMQSPATQPPLVFYIPAAFDPDLGKVVMFGGMSKSQATWAWNGSDWSLVQAFTPPPLLNSQGLAWDGRSNQLIMFGGAVQNLLVNDTYKFVKR